MAILVLRNLTLKFLTSSMIGTYEVKATTQLVNNAAIINEGGGIINRI
jgi:hypothetical protein